MAEEVDFKNVEEKWLKNWEDSKAFQSNPDGRERFYITVAYPYPSGSMHVGHARTYTVPDVIARFKRMQGYNVLFPMAWHVTGTPIIGAVNRLKNREEKQLRILKEVCGVSESDLKQMETPMGYARYFIENHYYASMRRLGYTIDWRRQFTTNDKHYNMFVTWQYLSLHKRGLLKEGLHPVKYCLHDRNPVTTHDLLEGEDADIQEFTLLKFKFDKEYLIAATLRPETVFGQTNMWVGPDIEYVKAKVGSESWIISEQCAKKLELQGKKVEVTGKVKGSSLIGEYCTAPGIKRDIIILPSGFCDPAIGSGLVTSVPSDAPYDWMGLKDLQENNELCEKYGLDWNKVKSIEVIPIIRTEEFGDRAALKVCEDMGITSQKDTKKLEEATSIVYKTGFHSGVMNENCGRYKGMAVVRAKEKVKEELLENGEADKMLEFSEKVRCRCGGDVVVANAESWFVDYSNEDWKEVTRAAIGQLNTIPEKTKQEYLNTVDRMHPWPCIRNFGLGTRLPIDDRFMIEPLSDSTIYMAYYTISHILKELKPEQLSEEFFSYVFRNEGKPDEVSKRTGIKLETLKKIKESFDYWYPQNWRCSALELIQNHLTFMMYHHTALFNADKWPRGIATFGMGLLEGQKMSSSKGNVVLLKDAIVKHGADVIRLFLMGNAEPWQDFDWRESFVQSTSKKMRNFYEMVSEPKGSDLEVRDIDRWLLSRLNRTIKGTTESLEIFQTRKALQQAFYEMFGDINWYMRRAEPNRKALSRVYHAWVRLMAPFTPFICEELWSRMGEKGFISNAEYPKPDESLINPEIEAIESMIQAVMDDVQNILDVTKVTPKTIHLYVAPEWKRKVYNAIADNRGMKELMADPELKKYGKEIANIMKKRRDELPRTIATSSREKQALDDAVGFLEEEFSCQFKVHEKADFDPEGKARYALPAKPGIYIES
ncbi:MAG: leucine--tRNA ligase [Candidatus Altiarchaeota archaeon]